MTRILICGDSFAADWTPQFPHLSGWVNLLADIHTVNNIAQAGVSEYKILKQVRSANLELYDAIIIAHTSPNRVHVGHHPLHSESMLHKDCDFIFKDIIDSDSKSLVVNAGINYFKYIFDEKYYADLHELMYEEIVRITPESKTLHLSFFKDMQADINLHHVFVNNTGTMNHLNAYGNQQVISEVTQWLTSVC